MDVTSAPVVEMPWLISEPILTHDWILTTQVAQIGASSTEHPRFPRPRQALVGVQHGFFETRRRHQLLQLIRPVDNHQYARTTGEDFFQPGSKERNMEADDQIRCLDRGKRALTLANRRHPHLGPRRD